jgi:hypothetical protein
MEFLQVCVLQIETANYNKFIPCLRYALELAEFSNSYIMITE